MEYLETWVIKQHDLIENLNQKFSRQDKNGVIVEESSEIVSVRKKVLGIELDVDNLKKTSLKHEENPKKVDSSLHVKKCKECEENFVKNSDLEKHLIDKHGQEKAFKCENGSKTFVLEWMMKKHMMMHDEKISMCKFFTNSQHCPYEEMGCKFSHEAS